MGSATRIFLLLLALTVFCLCHTATVEFEAFKSSLDGIHQLHDGIEFVYQLPQNIETLKLRGVVMLAHGCSHQSTDWWPKGKSCPNCIGLPVETSIVKDGLERNFAMIAITSDNRLHKCWTDPDISRVTKVIDFFYINILKDYAKSLPLHLLGGSSGGGFVGYLAQSTMLSPIPQSICVQISPLKVLSNYFKTPVLFVLMPKDDSTLRRVERTSSKLKSFNKILRAEDKAITPTFFFDHSHGEISKGDSAKVYQSFLESQYINAGSLKLLDDPRTTDWRTVSRMVSKLALSR
jgi:hypothetical protein